MVEYATTRDVCEGRTCPVCVQLPCPRRTAPAMPCCSCYCASCPVMLSCLGPCGSVGGCWASRGQLTTSTMPAPTTSASGHPCPRPSGACDEHRCECQLPRFQLVRLLNGKTEVVPTGRVSGHQGRARSSRVVCVSMCGAAVVLFEVLSCTSGGGQAMARVLGVMPLTCSRMPLPLLRAGLLVVGPC